MDPSLPAFPSPRDLLSHSREIGVVVVFRASKPPQLRSRGLVVIQNSELSLPNGSGLGVATESCILNPNRNPGATKAQIEAEFRRLFGIEHMLWMPGVPAQEITDGHVDFTVRFSAPDQIVFAFDANYEPTDRRNEKALVAAIAEVNALPEADRARLFGGSTGPLTAQQLPTPDLAQVHAATRLRNQESPIAARDLETFISSSAAGYIGYYEANGCIMLGQFGDDEADRAAFDLVSELYPDRVVIQITTDGISNGGGTIHCSTQQQPRLDTGPSA